MNQSWLNVTVTWQHTISLAVFFMLILQHVNNDLVRTCWLSVLSLSGPAWHRGAGGVGRTTWSQGGTWSAWVGRREGACWRQGTSTIVSVPSYDYHRITPHPVTSYPYDYSPSTLQSYSSLRSVLYNQLLWCLAWQGLMELAGQHQQIWDQAYLLPHNLWPLTSMCCFQGEPGLAGERGTPGIKGMEGSSGDQGRIGDPGLKGQPVSVQSPSSHCRISPMLR